MPPIRSIEILSDRVVVTTPRGTRTFLYSQVSQNVINQGTAAIESFCNTWLNDPANTFAVSLEGRHFYCAVRVVTLNPLSLTIAISNTPITDRSFGID